MKKNGILNSDISKVLSDLGHKDILFIRGDSSLSYDIKENIYLEILDKKGLDYKNIVNVGMGNTIEVIQNTKDILIKKLEEDKNTWEEFSQSVKRVVEGNRGIVYE